MERLERSSPGENDYGEESLQCNGNGDVGDGNDSGDGDAGDGDDSGDGDAGDGDDGKLRSPGFTGEKPLPWPSSSSSSSG